MWAAVGDGQGGLAALAAPTALVHIKIIGDGVKIFAAW